MATIADSSYPYTAGSVDEPEWNNLWRLLLKPGVIPNATTTGAGTNVAALSTSLLPFGDLDGMQVKVTAGEFFDQGNYGKWNSQATISGFSSAGVGAGEHRVDAIVVRNNLAADRMEIDTLTGSVTDDGVWTLPTLTIDATMSERLIGLVNITQGLASMAAANVIDARVFTRPAMGGPRPGSYLLSAESAVPGAVPLDGRLVNRFTHRELFAAIGTTYGAGDGVTTFAVPDRRGEVLAILEAMGGTASMRMGNKPSLTTHYGAATSVPAVTDGNDYGAGSLLAVASVLSTDIIQPTGMAYGYIWSRPTAEYVA